MHPVALSQSTANATHKPQGYLSYPVAHGDRICFQAENDLWLFHSQLKSTHRITQDANLKRSACVFSPDGDRIAFVASPDSVQDIYTVDIHASLPKRITYNGYIQRIVAWTDKGIWCISSHEHPFGMGSLYCVDIACGSVSLILREIEDYSQCPATSAHVVQRKGYGYATWKRYQGGTAAELWIKHAQGTYQPLLQKKHNLLHPRIHEGRVYFLSDYQDHGNIYSCDFSGSNTIRHTHHQDFYARSFCIHKDTLYYHAGGCIYTTTTHNGKNHSSATMLSIPFPSTMQHVEPDIETHPMHLSDAEVSKNGDFIACIKRGNLHVMPTWHGGVRMLLQSTNTRYKHLRYAQGLACFVAIADQGFSDQWIQLSGQHEHIASHIDLQEVGRVTDVIPAPKGPHVALCNIKQALFLLDCKRKHIQRIDTCDFAEFNDCAWSQDGSYLAYSKHASAKTKQIVLYELSTQKHHQITTPLYHASNPCFDENGLYLCFLSADHYYASPDPMCFQYNFKRPIRPYLVTLQAHTTSPFHWRPESERKPSLDTGKAKKKIPAIDTQGIETRVLPIPVLPDDYVQIDIAQDKIIFCAVYQTHKNKAKPSTHTRLKVTTYCLKDLKVKTLYTGIKRFSLSAGKAWSVLLEDQLKLRVLATGEKIDEDDESFKNGGIVNLERAETPIQPLHEWSFMLKEAWRLQSELYWDERLAGLSWQTIYDRYVSILPKVTTRADFNDLLSEMQGELGSSHAYVWGGDLPEYKSHPMGYLTCTTTYDEKQHAHIIRSIEPQRLWQPHSTHARSPLREAGIDLQVGDAILTINGQPLTANTPINGYLINQAHRSIGLTVKRKRAKKTEHLSVNPVHCLHPLQYANWVENNRETVYQRSKGRVGYVHIPDMQNEGYAEFMRSFLPHLQLDGLIIDVRYNRGGHISSLILQKLAIKRFGMDIGRWQKHGVPYPIESTKGNLVALCNAYTASDGDMFAHAFKALSLGPLVGERTWGGIIGMHPRFSFLDGGVATQPEFAAWFDRIGYRIENHGVEPDITVQNAICPETSTQDAQLQHAIDLACQQLDRATALEKKQARMKRPSLSPTELPPHA